MSQILHGYRAWAWLLLLCAALYLPGIAALPAFDRDEGRFMQASRQMLETGDLVRIRFQDEARNKKPAGIHWLQAGTTALVTDPGTTERWSYRIPSVLGATGAVLLLFALALLFCERRAAFLAAALLASSLLLVAEAHIAKTDAMLLATVMAAMYGLARAFVGARAKGSRDWASGLWFWVGIGAGILIKGPITPLVAGLALVGLLVTGRQPGLWHRLRPLVGLPLMIVIAAPWFIAIVFVDQDFLREAAGRDLFAKVLSAQESHGFPPGFYLLLMTATFAPGSLFVWPALVSAWRRRREDAIRFALVWLVPFWVILEIVPTKLPHYVLPLYPALALLTAMAADAAEAGLVTRLKRWSTRLVYLIWFALILGFAVAAALLGPLTGSAFQWAGVAAVAAAALFGGLVLAQAWRGEVCRALLLAAVAAPVVLAPVFGRLLPQAEAIWPSRAADRLVRASVTAGQPLPPVVATGYREPSLVFALGTDLHFAEPGPLVARLKTLKDWRAIVTDDKLAAFETAADAAGLARVRLSAVRRFNYSKGKWVTLILFAPPAAKR